VLIIHSTVFKQIIVQEILFLRVFLPLSAISCSTYSGPCLLKRAHLQLWTGLLNRLLLGRSSSRTSGTRMPISNHRSKRSCFERFSDLRQTVDLIDIFFHSKLDFGILIVSCLGFFMRYLDSSNLANAYVSGSAPPFVYIPLCT
jgi:hypothetical protein